MGYRPRQCGQVHLHPALEIEIVINLLYGGIIRKAINEEPV